MDPSDASYWLSRGYSQQYADGIIDLQETLIHEAKTLKCHKEQLRGVAGRIASIDDINIVIDAVNIPEGLLLHDDALIPHWKWFGSALRSLSPYRDLFNLDLEIVNVQLSDDVLGILAEALKHMPLKAITLNNNQFGSFGYQVLSHLLNVIDIENIEIEIAHNVMDQIPVQIQFINSLWKKRFAIKELIINDCGIGHRFPIVHVSVPKLLEVDTVVLSNNNLGSYGASIISGYLSTDPSISRLCLAANGFDDKDAAKFANALMYNKNLKYLRIYNNKFTSDGIRALVRSVYDDSSLNYIHDSNTTCQLRLLTKNAQAPDGLDLSMLDVNTMDFNANLFPNSALRRCQKVSNGNQAVAKNMLQSMGRRKTKIMHALSKEEARGGRFDIGIPMEIMPEALECLQECGILYYETEDHNLNILFQVIRSMQGVVSVDARSNKSSRDDDASLVVISKKKSRSF